MKRRNLVLLIVFVFLFANTLTAFAKGSSGSRSSGSKSSSSSSSKSSGGYSGSSSSKSSGSKSTSSSSKSSGGYSGSSSSKNVPGVSSGSSSANKSSSSSAKTSSGVGKAKTTYMQNTYKKAMSNSNYKAYQQTLNTDQKKSYDSGMSRNYTNSNRMNFDDALRTRPQRITNYNNQHIFVNVNTGMFGSGFNYGSAHIGIWDMWFLMRASDLFWYHHWNDITPYQSYFNAQEFSKMEARVRDLEADNKARDQNYLEPGVDPDLQFSKEYQEKHLDNLYYTNKYAEPSTNPFLVIIILIGIVIVLIILVRKFSKPKTGKAFNSRIY